MLILHPSYYLGINLTPYFTGYCRRNTWQYIYKLTRHIQVKGFGLFFRTLILSNNIWSDNGSKTFKILMETICSDLALSLCAPGEFRIPLAPTEKRQIAFYVTVFCWFDACDWWCSAFDFTQSMLPKCALTVSSCNKSNYTHSLPLVCTAIHSSAHVDFSAVNWPI